jgi:hypothetical protein
LPVWVLPTPFLPRCAEHFRDEFEDIYPDPLVLSHTGTATRGVRGEAERLAKDPHVQRKAFDLAKRAAQRFRDK